MDHTAKSWEVSALGSEWGCQGIEGLSKIKIRLELSGSQSLADRANAARRWVGLGMPWLRRVRAAVRAGRCRQFLRSSGDAAWWHRAAWLILGAVCVGRRCWGSAGTEGQ